MIGDNIFERNVISTAHRLSIGQGAAPGIMKKCAIIFLSEFDSKKEIPGCSNGALQASMYVPPRRIQSGYTLYELLLVISIIVCTVSVLTMLVHFIAKFW